MGKLPETGKKRPKFTLSEWDEKFMVGWRMVWLLRKCLETQKTDQIGLKTDQKLPNYHQNAKNYRLVVAVFLSWSVVFRNLKNMGPF